MDLLGSIGNAASNAAGDATKLYSNLFSSHYSDLMKSFFGGKYPVSKSINELNKLGLTGYDASQAAPQMSQSGLGEANQNVNTGLGGGLTESQATHGLSLGTVLSALA